MTTGPDASRPSWGRLLFLALVGAHAIFLLLWVATVALYGPRQNDWAVFKGVADRFVAGDTFNLYTRGADTILPGYFWIYPPFVLLPLAVLAPLPPLGAYLLLAGLAVAATARSLALLHRVLRVRDAADLWVLSVVCSAPLLTTVVTGQLSGVLLLAMVGAGALWTAGNVLGAGAVLGLMVAKPNWGIVFGLMMLLRREWRAAAAMAGVAALCCAAGLLPGAHLWRDFFHAASVSIGVQGHYDLYTIVTLRGFLEAVMPSPAWAYGVWAVAAVVLAGAAVRLWLRDAAPMEHLAVAVLFGTAVNPYAHFYDALLLVLPATVWWAGRSRWPRPPWLTVGGLLGAAWIGEHAAWSWPMVAGLAGGGWKLPFSLVGPVAAVWLGLWSAVAEARRPSSD